MTAKGEGMPERKLFGARPVVGQERVWVCFETGWPCAAHVPNNPESPYAYPVHEYVLASRLAEVERERDEARNALLKAVFGDTERAEHLAQLVEKMKAERDAERARAERWKAVALEWLRVMSAWRSVYPHMGATEAVNAHNEALAAESAATERKT